jgi:HlyD family secretion protein
MKKNKTQNPVLLIALVSGLIILTLAGWLLMKPEPLILQGEIEATQIKVASKIPARIAEIRVKEGQSVKKGDTLIILDSPEIRAKMEQAQAAQKAAGAQKQKALTGARREEVQAAFNMWQKADAGLQLADKTYRRIKNLYTEGVVPAQKLDEAETNYNAAKMTESAARAQYEMAEKGAREEDKTAAGALWEQASGVVSEVTAYLNETVIVAPKDGEIATLVAEPGELVGSGFPILTIVDLSDVWVTFNLREDLLANLRINDELEAEIPALGNQTVRFKINYINALGDFATWHATKSSGDFDRKTFEVRGTPTTDAAALRPGMSALVNWTLYIKK